MLQDVSCQSLLQCTSSSDSASDSEPSVELVSLSPAEPDSFPSESPVESALSPTPPVTN